MKLTAFSCFSFVFALLFCSCQKDIPDYVNGEGDSTSNNSNPALVKYYTEDLYAISTPNQQVKDSFGLTYDNKGRLLSMNELDSTDGLQFVYQYNNSNSFTLDQYEGGALQLHEIFYLNNSSFLDSTLQHDTEGDTTTEKYIYNASKQLIRLNRYDYSTLDGSSLNEFDTYAYDAYNNVIREVNYDLSAANDSTVITSTYPNLINSNLNVGLNIQLPQKYLPDVVTQISNAATVSVTHAYTFDNKKRLTTDNATLSNGYIAIKRYYY